MEVVQEKGRFRFAEVSELVISALFLGFCFRTDFSLTELCCRIGNVNLVTGITINEKNTIVAKQNNQQPTKRISKSVAYAILFLKRILFFHICP